MSEISGAFSRTRPKCALIPFIIAGAPSIYMTAQTIKILDHIGADIIEVGLPYSDPLADGPIIQQASSQALAQGTTIEHIFSMFEELKDSIKKPIVLFAYYNLVVNYGVEKFIKRIKNLGIKGLLVPDLPCEEIDLLINYAYKFNVKIILLIAPTSSKTRINKISKKSQGFIYLVSSTGVTGLRNHFQDNTNKLIQEVKRTTTKPIAVGFGISNPDHVTQIKSWGADGIIIGSACVKILSNINGKNALLDLTNFISAIKLAL